MFVEVVLGWLYMLFVFVFMFVDCVGAVLCGYILVSSLTGLASTIVMGILPEEYEFLSPSLTSFVSLKLCPLLKTCVFS